MKIDEIPQDEDPAFEGSKKLCYAIDGNGQIVRAQSSGWSVEAAVKDIAWKAIHEDLARTESAVAQGRASPLEYYMKLRQMDVALLAQNMGISSWRLRWHLRPKSFAKLGEDWLKRYAECLDVPIEALRSPKGAGKC